MKRMQFKRLRASAMVLIYPNSYRAQGFASPGDSSVNGKEGSDWGLVMEIPGVVRNSSVWPTLARSAPSGGASVYGSLFGCSLREEGPVADAVKRVSQGNFFLDNIMHNIYSIMRWSQT
jgi:hypothetical protein